MIVDSSALMAILEQEPGSESVLQCAAAAETCRMSVANRLEASIVADARSSTHGARLDELLDVLEVELVEVTPRDGDIARSAYRRFGRGSGSPARLNFGDCFAYALSVRLGEPLLFVRDDFTHTDILPALP